MPVTWPIANGFDLILIAGQSNANGAGTPRDGGIDVSGGAYQLGQGASGAATQRVIMDAPEALDHDDNTVPGTRIGFAVKFGREYYIPNRLAVGRKLMFVPCAHGGQGFSNNGWNPGNTYYNNAVSRTNYALQSRWLGQNRLIAMLWAQGEADTSGPDFGGTLTIPQYEAAQEACFAGLRADIRGAADMPIILTNIRPEWGTLQNNGDDLFNAIADTPNRVANCFYVDPTGLTGNNVLEEFHYDAVSQRTLADRFWTVFDANVPA